MISNNFDHIGRTLGPEISRQAPPVGISLDQLEKELHHLREGITQLTIRLSVVMRPVPEQGAKSPMTPMAGGSPMVNHIESLNQLTRFISSDVYAMLDCIEI